MNDVSNFLKCLTSELDYNQLIQQQQLNIPFLLDMSLSFKSLLLEKTMVIEKSKNKPKRFESRVIDNANEIPFLFLYKTGDDLRKDHVILQAITLIKQVSLK